MSTFCLLCECDSEALLLAADRLLNGAIMRSASSKAVGNRVWVVSGRGDFSSMHKRDRGEGDDLSMYKRNKGEGDCSSLEGRAGMSCLDKRVRDKIYPCKRDRTGITIPIQEYLTWYNPGSDQLRWCRRQSHFIPIQGILYKYLPQK